MRCIISSPPPLSPSLAIPVFVSAPAGLSLSASDPQLKVWTGARVAAGAWFLQGAAGSAISLLLDAASVRGVHRSRHAIACMEGRFRILQGSSPLKPYDLQPARCMVHCAYLVAGNGSQGNHMQRPCHPVVKHQDLLPLSC